MTKNILTLGGWIKQTDLSYVNTNGDKVRVYRRPEQNLEVAINAIKMAQTEKKREVVGLKTLEIEIQNKLYLLREGQVIKLLECKPEKNEVNPPFFSNIQRYVPNTTNSSLPLPEFFISWFTALRQVYTLIQKGNLSIDAQQKLFFYLAHRYHYNAPFSQNENERLGYQTSPLAITERNSYLRSSQTIWMRLASELVYQQLNTNEKAISIVWIDHLNFVSFLSQFYQVMEVPFITQDTLQTFLTRWLDSYKEPLRPLYIFLKNIPGKPKDKLKRAKEFAEKTLKEITDKLVEIENNQNLDNYFNIVFLPKTLREAALLILAKGGLGKKTDQYHTEETLAFLKDHYGQQLIKEQQQLHRKIQSSFAYGNWQEDQIQFLFRLYKNYSDSFPSTLKFKKPTDIEGFLKDKNASKTFISQVLKVLSASDFLKFENYIKTFQKDISDNVPKSQRKAEDVVGIFYADSFEGLHALISPHHGEGIHHLVTVLGNLGYSPDASRFLRTLLREYPSFFPVQKQCSFLEEAIKTKFLWLPKEMQGIALSALANLNILNNPMNTLDFQNIYSDFGSTLKNLTSVNTTQGWSKLYCRFLIDLLDPIFKDKKNLNESTLFAIKKITYSIKNALKHENEIHCFIQNIQNALEAWMLYIDINPLVTDPTQIFQNALPSKPTVVHFTSYAMRSFTRVLQALAPTYSNNKTNRLRVQVFNQSYFELITNMERFRDTADIFISQSDAEIKDCDVYFIDIHPNNAVEVRLFSHDIPKIINTLKTFPQNRPRTFVVDITLSSLSASEIRKLLHEANPLIQSGQLNLVLIQSLTKFSQLGLDKLSAGFLAAYNTNQQIWKVFNDQLNIFQNQEPIDSLTLQFFACLTHYTTNFQKEYIKQINQNTQCLYHMVLEKYQTLNLPISKQILALTCNTDLNTCYLAFNSTGIFALLDPSFNLSLKEISCFTKDIIEGLFVPLAEWLDLPLTERMSIGFPLSSINECMHVIRFTVGLERDLLPKYADIITYICFILNRERKPEFFFERGPDQSKVTYPKRYEYFEEKVNIFKAMYPVRGKNADPVQIQEPLENWTNGYREFILDKGTIQVVYLTEQSQWGGPIKQWMQTLKEQELLVHFGPSQDIPLTDEKITPFIKCLLASCLTKRQTKLWDGQIKNEHIITLTSFNQPRNGLNVVAHLSFGAFFYTRIDNSIWNRFGYYNVSSADGSVYRLSFDFKDKKLWLVLNEKWFGEGNILIKKGHEILPATWLDIEEKWHLFERASYVPLRELPITGHRYEPDPNDPTKIKLMFNNEGPFVLIERDLLAFKIDGLSLYCRKETKDTVQLEIDFWGIKNPIHARFLSLYFCYVALYKEKVPFDFVSESYSRITLFQENYDLKKLREVAREILDHREEILFRFDKKRPTKEDRPVETNSRRSLSRFRVFNSVIPYLNFIENICSSQKEMTNSEIEFKKFATFCEFLTHESIEQAKNLKRDFSSCRLIDAAKTQKCLEDFKRLVIQEIKSEAYFTLLRNRDSFMKKNGSSQVWNSFFAEFVQMREVMRELPFSPDTVLTLTLKLNEPFEKELVSLAENFEHPKFSAQYALLSTRDQDQLSRLISNLRRKGIPIQRPGNERQILQAVITSATDMLNAGKVEKSEVLKKLKKTNDGIEKLTISGYPVDTYIEQYFNWYQQITNAIVHAFKALILEKADLEHALSLVGAGRTNVFLGMEQILAELDSSYFCQPVQDDDLRHQLINALCQVQWDRLIMPQISEIAKDTTVQFQVQALIDKVILELRLHYYQIKPRGLVELDNPGGGDCLIYSYLNSHHAQNVQSLQKSDAFYQATDKEVQDLRTRMADEIINHLDEFEGIIDRFLSDQFMTFVSKKSGIGGVRGATIDRDFKRLLSPYFKQLEDFLKDPAKQNEDENMLYSKIHEELIQQWRTTKVFRTLAKDYAEQIVSKQGKYLTSPAIEALARVTKNPIIVEKDGVFFPFGVIYDAPPVYIRNKDESHFISLVLPDVAEAMSMGNNTSSAYQDSDTLDNVIFKDYSEKFEKLTTNYAGVYTIKNGKVLQFDSVKAGAYAKELDRLLYEMGMKEPSIKSPLLLKLGVQMAIELESLFGNGDKGDPRTAFAANNIYKDKGRFVLEMRGMALEWNLQTATYVLKGINLGKSPDLSNLAVHPHAGLENYNLVCYANTALQSLTSQRLIAQLKLIQKSYEGISKQSQACIQNLNSILTKSGFKGQLHEFLLSKYGLIQGALSILKSGEEMKKLDALKTIDEILRLFDSKKALPESRSDLQNLANAFLLKMKDEKWQENAYLADTATNRLLCLEMMQSLLTEKSVISARKLYEAIGFGAAYQDMEEFATRFLDQIGFKPIVLQRVLEGSPQINQIKMLAPEIASGIQLPPQKGSIQTAVDHFFAIEELEKPTEEGYTHSKMTLSKAPDILPLTLKRFGTHRWDEVKLDNEISIILENGTKVMYTLQSVGCHLEWGHYVAGCRYEKESLVQWLEHNDSHTTHIGSDIQRWNVDPARNAYLLVYHRNDLKKI